MSVRRGKYWEPDPNRQAKALLKRRRRQQRNMRRVAAGGNHVLVAHSGTKDSPGFTELRPIELGQHN